MYANLKVLYRDADRVEAIMAWKIEGYSRAAVKVFEDLAVEEEEPVEGRELVVSTRDLLRIEADF